MNLFYCPKCTGVCLPVNHGDQAMTGTCDDCHLHWSIGYSPSDAPFEPNMQKMAKLGDDMSGVGEP